MEEQTVDIQEQTFPQNTLEIIISQVKDVLIKANSLILSYQDKLKSVVEKESIITDREKSCKEKEEGLSIREQECLKVENAVALKKQADQLFSDNRFEAQSLKEERKKFDDYKLGENSRLNELRISVQRESDNLIIQRKNIEDEVNKQVTEFIEKFKQSKA